MTRHGLLYRLLLLCVIVSSSLVCALRVSSASLSNASVSAISDLFVSLDLQGDAVPADGVFAFLLHPDLMLDGTSSVVLTALLRAQLDGSIQTTVNTTSNTVAIAREANGSDVYPTEPLAFQIANVTAPSVVGYVSLGFLVVGNSTHPEIHRFALPAVWISPGQIWNTHVAFAHLISGRTTAFSVELAPAHAVPSDGSLLLHLPREYASVNALGTVVLSRVEQADAPSNEAFMLRLVNGSTLEITWNSSVGATGLKAMQKVVFHFEGLQHPAIEGPVGRLVRVDTTNARGSLVDQTQINVYQLLLERASVIVSQSRVFVQEGSSSGVKYAVRLTAPPQHDAGLSVAIASLVTSPVSILIEPNYLHFSKSNWSAPVNVSVRVPDDFIALPVAPSLLLTHSVAESSTETTFAPGPNVSVHVEDDDLPIIHVSRRYAAVVEGLRNDSYTLVLLSQPTRDVVIDMDSSSPFVQTLPTSITFSPLTWNTPQSVEVFGTVGTTAVSTSVKVTIHHRVSSADILFGAIFPQSSISAYFEPLSMIACPEPCRPGWFPLTNSTTGSSQCVSCPLGYFCPGECAQPTGCSPGTFSDTPSASSNVSCRVCPDGSYSNLAGMNACLPCPAGAQCPNKSMVFDPCPVGTYAEANQVECRPCPVGTHSNTTFRSRCEPCPSGAYCPGEGHAPVVCPPGQFSLDNGTQPCHACPAGYMCRAATEFPQQCPDGTYSPANASECKTCEAGYYCPSPALGPIKCSQGTYSLSGATTCTVCPYGYTCTFPDPPRACSAGQVNNADHSACILCPKGFECSPLQGITTSCASGSYSLDGEGRCTMCPKGYACPVPTSAPVRCSSGTYSPQGSSECLPCPAGYACPQPGMDPVPCGVSQFSLGSSTSCSSCPAGKSCPVVASAPVDCPIGSFSTGGASSCTQCPPGYACPDITSSQRLACPVGTYSTGSAATCTPCPTGFSCQFTNSSVFSPCPPGYYSPDGSASCLECPRGYYCDVPYEMPKNCSVGSYSLKGSTSCIPCAPGYECPRSDQLPQPCPVGYYSEGAVANCRSCRPGYMCSLASDNPTPPEDACPMGGYCNPPTTFFLCPAGTYGNVTAGESVDHACAPCPEGYFCEMGSTPLTKQNCPSGFVCPVGTKRASQYPCPAGTYNRLPNQRGFESCLACPAGSYCEAGSSEPVVCPKGYYCVERTQSATQYPCPAGTYSGPRTGLTVGRQCLPCELGSYCPEGSSSPTACPAGTYNPFTGSAKVHECLDCPPGYACPHVGQFEYVDRCAKGHYCPSGTVVATANPCPPGTYTERIDLIRVEDCTICPLRHACPQGTGGEAQTMLDCGAGFFCPNGTAFSKQFPCPPGTWSSSTSLADSSECSICPVGKYCSGGKSFIDGDCSPGYYCPLGTPSPTKFPCPSGTYTAKTWLFEPTQCDDCPPGSYCPSGSVAPIPCKPGSFTSLNNTKSVGPGAAWPECTICPAGYYCTDGSVAPVPCGKGSYSPRGSKSCTKCEAGYFCNSNTTSDANMRSDVASWVMPGSLFGKCYNGTYCPPGTDHEPALEIDACPRGYFCPKGAPAPVICPAGTYSNLTGQDDMSDCIPTPAGFYSLEGALQPTGKCDPGFYCPERSTTKMQVACPARYYLNRTGGQREEDCAVCVSGAYCPRGSAYPIECPMGYYCRTGVSSPQPCPIGTYSNVTGIKQVEDCLPCPPGMYCDSTGLTVPRGQCDPGYYCTIGSYTSAPMDYEVTLFGITNHHVGGQCPRGAYCPLGSALPTPCPPGTFNNFTGLETETQCVPCLPGKYCGTPGLSLPTGDCFSGYYCTGRAKVPTQFPTQPGYFSGNGSTAPVPCPAGQFNLHAAQDRCVECPAGFYCESPGTIRPTICLKGSYCPKATALAMKCPPGTFSSLEGLISIDQCEPCPPGFFCDSFGLIDPSGPCFEGFVCTGGSPVANPVDPLFGFVCPAGHYCPQGSGAPLQCPRGSFRPTTGGANMTSCTLCPDGSFCGGTALTSPTGLCSEGYYCKQGNDVSTPTNGVARVNGVDVGGDLCPIGSYCPQGTSQPKLCPEGSYVDTRGANVCITCPAGFFCPLGSSGYDSKACPQGYFCPAGTKRGSDNPCLPGTFGNRTGLQTITQCTLAPGGMYVEGYAATKPTGLCRSGFYCSGGSPTSTPPPNSTTGGPCLKGTNCPEGSAIPIVCAAGFYCSSTNTEKALPCDPGHYCIQGSYTATPTGELNALGSIGDVCTRGHYCPLGTSNPNPCPPGTYSENTQNANISQCSPCLPGYVCSISGIVTPYQKCPAGFLCKGGKREATERCPMGSECPEGSSAPRPCPAGTFSDEEGLGQCKLCPERYFCLPGSITPERCPAGYYCPLQTTFGTKFKCPAGTFSNATSLASSSECASCPPGKFCSGSSPTDRPSGDCAPGHYCAGGATTATPMDGITGGYCAEGHICLGAAWLPDPVDGQTGRGCQPGFYCPRGSSSQSRCEKGTYNAFEMKATCVKCPAGGYCDTNATMPVPCPLRYYCPEGAVEPVLCPSGTYGHTTGLESSAQCAPCAAGKYCVGGTLTASCAAGYYCKLYNEDPNPVAKVDFGGPCPVGHYCPEGVLDPIPCPNSTARLETHGTSVDDCGPCPAGMSCENGAVTVPCPAGYYCVHAKSAVPCPIGTFNPAQGKSIFEDCLACEAGKVCNRTAIVELTEYYDCPAAHYCPEGTIEPIPCPIGRFRRTTGGKSLSDCALCTGGSYCEVRTSEPTVCEREVYCPLGSGKPIVCPGGSYCPYNSTAPLECPSGYYCPIGVSLPIICGRGFYCPAGSVAPSACPLGYIGRLTPLSGVLSRLHDACESCPPGTYGIDPNRTKCEQCPEGFICLEATKSDRPKSKEVDNGYPCPPGYYCPAGSSKEIACLSGTYQPVLSATNSSACLLCPVNSYQSKPAQISCLPCSKSSYAAEGAIKCTCKGSHRAFQMTDGYCICEPGYEFYDQNMVLRSDEDDDVDCQPIVYDRCGSNQVRSDGGSCVSASEVSCAKTCGNKAGTLVSSLGVCQCDDQADIDLVCDKACRETAMQVQVNSTTGRLQLFDPVTGFIEPLPDGTSSGIISKVSCAPSSSGSDCQLHTVALKSSGFAGSYDIPSGIASTAPSAGRSRRRLETEVTTSIDNPMVCLNVGQGIMFDLSTPGSYPIYMKDSLLNTNPDFDFGAFRALATRVRANASTVSAFAFSFTEPGTYVFGNSLNGAAKTVITVMKSGTSCPTEAPIVPLSEKSLIAVSAKRRTDEIILAPDWGLIIGLLGGLLGMVVSIIAGLYYFRTKSWATSSFRKRVTGYRTLNKATDLASLHSKGATVANKAPTATPDGEFKDVTPPSASTMVLDDGIPPLVGSPRWAKSPTAKDELEGYKPDLDRWDEEDLDLRELIDRLQYHHEAVTKCFDDQKGDVNKLLQKMQVEAAELKRLFVDSLAHQRVPSVESSEEENESNPGEETQRGLPSRGDDSRVSSPMSVVTDTMEREIADRQRFRKRRNAGLEELSSLLKTVEEWGKQPSELTHVIIEEIASDDNKEFDPECTIKGDTPSVSHLEDVQSVLRDLKTLLCSNPATITNSSLVQIAEAEKARREIGHLVVDAALRKSDQLLSDAPFSKSSSGVLAERSHNASDTALSAFVNDRDRVGRAANKEDEAFTGQLATLQMFGETIPKLVRALDEMETEFKQELLHIREEQNPSKERAAKAEMEQKLERFIKDLAKGAGRLQGRLAKGQAMLVKSEKAAIAEEDVLAVQLRGERQRQRTIAEAERQKRLAAKAEKMAAESEAATSVARPNEPAEQTEASKQTDESNLDGETSMQQIKELLLNLSNQQFDAYEAKKSVNSRPASHASDPKSSPHHPTKAKVSAYRTAEQLSSLTASKSILPGASGYSSELAIDSKFAKEEEEIEREYQLELQQLEQEFDGVEEGDESLPPTQRNDEDVFDSMYGDEYGDMALPEEHEYDEREDEAVSGSDEEADGTQGLRQGSGRLQVIYSDKTSMIGLAVRNSERMSGGLETVNPNAADTMPSSLLKSSVHHALANEIENVKDAYQTALAEQMHSVDMEAARLRDRLHTRLKEKQQIAKTNKVVGVEQVAEEHTAEMAALAASIANQKLLLEVENNAQQLAAVSAVQQALHGTVEKTTKKLDKLAKLHRGNIDRLEASLCSKLAQDLMSDDIALSPGLVEEAVAEVERAVNEHERELRGLLSQILEDFKERTHEASPDGSKGTDSQLSEMPVVAEAIAQVIATGSQAIENAAKQAIEAAVVLAERNKDECVKRLQNGDARSRALRAYQLAERLAHRRKAPGDFNSSAKGAVEFTAKSEEERMGALNNNVPDAGLMSLSRVAANAIEKSLSDTKEYCQDASEQLMEVARLRSNPLQHGCFEVQDGADSRQGVKSDGEKSSSQSFGTTQAAPRQVLGDPSMRGDEAIESLVEAAANAVDAVQAQLNACKQEHARARQMLLQQLEEERLRQLQSLNERLKERQCERRSDGLNPQQAGGISGISDAVGDESKTSPLDIALHELERKHVEAMHTRLAERKLSALDRKQADDVADILATMASAADEKAAIKSLLAEKAESELSRMRDEHANDVRQLEESLKEEQSAIAHNGKAGNEGEVVAVSEEEVAKEHARILSELKMTQKAKEADALKRVIGAKIEAAKAIVTRDALAAMVKVEAERIRQEFDDNLSDQSLFITAEREKMKARLKERLVGRTSRGIVDPYVTSKRAESDEKKREQLAEALYRSIGSDLERIHNLNATDLLARKAECIREAEAQKMQVQDRCSKKTTAIEALRSAAIPCAITSETVIQDKAKALQDIDDKLKEALRNLEDRVQDQKEDTTAGAIDAAVEHAAMLESLLGDCRAEHDRAIDALRERLRSERKAQEMALENRLSAKRKHRLAAIEAAREENCIPISEEEQLSIEASLTEASRNERERLQMQLATDERKAATQLRDSHAVKVDAIASSAKDLLASRLTEAHTEREQAAAELQRILKEHDQVKQELRALLSVQQAQERQRLEEKLQQRRREKLSVIPDDTEKARVESELDALDHFDRCQLDEQITTREQNALQELTKTSSDEMQGAIQSVARADGEIAGIEAARSATEVAQETEVKRVERELEKALRAARANEMDDREARKARLISRLRNREPRSPSRIHEPGEQAQTPYIENPHHVVDDSAAVIDVIVPAVKTSIDEDILRLQAQYVADTQGQRDQIQRDAELQKERLRDRIARRKALIIGTGSPAGEEEEGLAQQQQGLITDRLCSKLDSQAAECIEAFSAVAIDGAAAQSATLEALLMKCRDSYDDKISALRESLTTHRKRQEAALKERLAAKRKQRLAAVQAARDENCVDIADAEVAAMNTTLEMNAKQESEALELQLTADEENAVKAIEDRYKQDVSAILSQVRGEAGQRKANAERELEEAEAEIKRLREDHDRSQRALAASLEVERAQQRHRLQDKLRQRRETTLKNVTNEDEKMRVDAELDARDELDRIELDDGFDEREVQLQRQSETQWEKIHDSQLAGARARGAVAAANAVLSAVDTVNEVELQRISSELEKALQATRAHEIDERAAKAQHLADRLRARKAKTRGEKRDSVAVRSEIDSLREQDVDARAAATEVMAHALDDEVERLKRQYEDGLRTRANQIRAETAAKKAMLQGRIEEKRKSLAVKVQRGEIDGGENEQRIKEEEEMTIKVIEDEAAAKIQAAKEDVMQQHERVCATLEEAANEYGDELERMLEECKRSHATSVEELRRALEQDRLQQERALQERLTKRREKRLANVSDAIARDVAEKELREEARVEQEQLDEMLAMEETRQLKEAEEVQQRRIKELADKLEQSSSERLVIAKADQEAAERELQRVRQEHTRELVALQNSLDAEKKRQEQRLQDKLTAKRARRAQESASGLSPEQVAELDAEDALERGRLQEVLQKRATEAVEEERLRHEELERTLQLQIAQAAAKAAAAEAARRAVDAARQAEMDRIAAEFKAARHRTNEEEVSDSLTQKQKLAARLAEKKARREKPKPRSDVKAKMLTAVKRAASISKSLRSITDTKAQQEIERLKEEHAAACKERFAALEQDAALRKARLAERVAEKRADTKSMSQVTGDVTELANMEALLHEEERAELQSIDESTAAEKQRILEELSKAQEQASAAMQEAAQRNAQELETMLNNCKKAHEEESRCLQKALDLERQRQEKALQDRIAKRKQAKKKQEVTLSKAVQESQDALQTSEINTLEEADEEKEKQKLQAELEAQEIKLWEEMRRKQEEELLALTKQAENIALRKQQEAKMVQESAQQELDRLKKEHEVEMAALTASLEAEQKRQQEQLQQRIAARRSRQQKQQKDVQDAAERERLMQQMEEQERADKLTLEQAIEAEKQRKIEEERERQRQQEAEIAARIAQASIDAAAADAASRAMDATRELELERLAKEFEEKSRELRQSDMADLVSQKRKLEARVAAKKQKRLMELEAKKELEKQKLRERLELETQGDGKAEEGKAEESAHAQSAEGNSTSEVYPMVTSRSDTGDATTKRPGSAMLRATLTGLLVDDSSDLKRMIELRLRKIEALLTHQKLPADEPVQVAEPKETDLVDPEEALQSYKQAVHDAIDDACQWRVIVKISDGTPLQVISRESMDDQKQTRFDFVNSLLRMMTNNTEKKSSVSIDNVVVANVLPAKRVGDAQPSYLDPVSHTLFIDAACFDQLSIGQIALLLIHAIAEAETGSNDVADPTFIGHVYRLLARCYESMFMQAQMRGRDDQYAESKDMIASLLAATPRIRRVESSHSFTKHNNGDIQLRDGIWREHIDDLRGFLTGLEVVVPSASAGQSGDVGGSPRTNSGALRRQTTAVPAAMSMSRSSSRFLLGSTDGTTDEMEELVVHELRRDLEIFGD